MSYFTPFISTVAILSFSLFFAPFQPSTITPPAPVDTCQYRAWHDQMGDVCLDDWSDEEVEFYFDF